ncbi:MAG: hypothetical protein II000_03625 [Clostridia bacterium]|nr:hypothetical protein [Clostridia bacterium]
MARKKSDRPEWFKFWRRNRQQLDIELLSMESRGRIFTNMMRYFDTGELDLVELSPLESMAFNVLKVNVDDSFDEWKEKSEKATASINERWHKSDDTEVYERIPANTKYTEDRGKKIEDRGQKIEDRGEREEDRSPAPAPPTVEDVREYCLSECISDFPAQRFVDHYAARNWKANGEPISDWKALVRVWVDRDKEKQKQKRITTFMDVPGDGNEEREQRRKELGLDW